MNKNLMPFILLGIGIFFLITWIYYKKWDVYNKFKPKKRIGKLIREILGESGLRRYLLVFSFIFLSIGLYSTYIIHVKPNLPARYSLKTDEISFSKKGGTIVTTTIKIMENNPNLNVHIDRASLSNNFIKSIPEFIWKIKDIKELNLTNNDIEKISVNKLKQSNIKKIILTGNPISKEEINKIEEIGIEVVKSDLN